MAWKRAQASSPEDITSPLGCLAIVFSKCVSFYSSASGKISTNIPHPLFYFIYLFQGCWYCSSIKQMVHNVFPALF